MSAFSDPPSVLSYLGWPWTRRCVSPSWTCCDCPHLVFYSWTVFFFFFFYILHLLSSYINGDRLITVCEWWCVHGPINCDSASSLSSCVTPWPLKTPSSLFPLSCTAPVWWVSDLFRLNFISSNETHVFSKKRELYLVIQYIHFQLRPVEPNPPDPRSVSSSDWENRTSD